MSGLPSGVRTERIFLIEGIYAADAAERRVPVRAEHLARIAAGVRTGTIIASGAYEDLGSSIVLLRADDEAAARAFADADVYVRTGIWTEVRVRPFTSIVVD